MPRAATSLLSCRPNRCTFRHSSGTPFTYRPRRGCLVVTANNARLGENGVTHMYFSDVFDIPESDRYEWFDPILNRDSPLFVDPFAIFADKAQVWQHAHDSIIDYFHTAFETLAKSGLRRSHQLYKRTLVLMEFPEPKEFRLGYAGKSADGSGSGPGLAELVVAAMAEAITRGLEDMHHFEELGILIEGINRDRISDIACNLLKPHFIKYTQDVCRSFDIPMPKEKIRHSAYDSLRWRWMDAEHEVPVDPLSGKPILLVPKRFLAELPKINAFEFDTSLRDDLNLDISTKVKKADIVQLARRNPEALRRWVTRQEASPPRPYDVAEDPKLIVKWQRLATSAVQAEPLEPAGEIRTEEELLNFVRGIIGKFRHWAEAKGGWRVFWAKALDAIPESNMQLLFLGVLDGYCDNAGLRLDREVETGRGPVDFTFTGDKRIRILLEMKKLTHGEFWHGLRIQTPIYMRGQEVSQAIFLVIRDSDTRPMRKRWLSLHEEAAVVNAETGLHIEIEQVDVLPKDPASKAKSEG